MTINDKIKQILIDKNVTPSYFADEIGVQRSSISHILSGRNRPSFDIIQKIIRRFPDLGYEWIMEEENQAGTGQNSSGYAGRNTGRSVQERSGPFNAPQQAVSYAPQQPSSVPGPFGIRSQRHEISPQQLLSQTPAPVGVGNGQSSGEFSSSDGSVEKKVERILVFYTDGSFREFSPATA